MTKSPLHLTNAPSSKAFVRDTARIKRLQEEGRCMCEKKATCHSVSRSYDKEGLQVSNDRERPEESRERVMGKILHSTANDTWKRHQSANRNAYHRSQRSDHRSALGRHTRPP